MFKPAKTKGDSLVRSLDFSNRNHIDDVSQITLRWLNTVFYKMENSRIRLVFLNCYFSMSNKEYRTDVKHRPKGSNLFTDAIQLSLLWQQ